MTEDLTGKRFGRWVVEGRAPDHVTEKGYRHIMWDCLCDCGNHKVVRGKSLKYGISTSCGCYCKEVVSKSSTRHGGFGSRLYNVWNSMRQRCNNPHCRSYKNYGGRGIGICREWDDFLVFKEWALNNGYDEDAKRGECTLDRIDVDKGYAPENCRWVSMRAQGNNKRDSIWITYNGENRPLTEWADIVGLDYTTLWKRYKNGLNPEQILYKS